MGKKADLNAREARWCRQHLYDRRGADFTPFLTVRDVQSQGKSHRIFLAKTGRVHHVLSRLEAGLFWHLALSPRVIDIREQQLIPLAASRLIAESLGIRHPRYGGRDTPMTIDFQVSYRDGPDRLFSVKQASALTDRTVAKANIEQVYAKVLGLSHLVITDRAFSQPMLKALAWVYSYANISEDAYPNQFPAEACKKTRQYILENREKPLNKICLALDAKINAEAGSSLKLARYLIGTGQLCADFRQGLDPLAPLNLFEQAV